MEENQITSRKNPLVRAAAQLKESAARRAQGKFLCEGARLCRDAAASGVQILQCFYTLRAQTRYRAYLEEILPAAREDWVIGESVAELLTDTRANQGIFCVCGVPAGLSASGGFAPTGPCLVLETLQDPGNLGAMLRSGEGAGITGVIMTKGTVDLFNPKTVRATMGSIFRIPFCYVDSLRPVIGEMRRRNVTVYAAHLRGSSVYDQFSFRGSSAFLIGNEGKGLKKETADLADFYVKIPMEGRVESLNAAVSASLLLYEAYRQRRIFNEHSKH